MLSSRKTKFVLNTLIPFVFILIKNIILDFYLKRYNFVYKSYIEIANIILDFIIMSLSFVGSVFVYRKLFLRDLKYINSNRVRCLVFILVSVFFILMKQRIHRIFFGEYKIYVDFPHNILEYCDMFFKTVVVFPCLDEFIFRKYLFLDIRSIYNFKNNLEKRSVKNTIYTICFMMVSSFLYGLLYVSVLGCNMSNLYQFFTFGMCLCIVCDVTCFSVSLAVRMCYAMIMVIKKTVVI